MFDLRAQLSSMLDKQYLDVWTLSRCVSGKLKWNYQAIFVTISYEMPLAKYTIVQPQKSLSS